VIQKEVSDFFVFMVLEVFTAVTVFLIFLPQAFPH